MPTVGLTALQVLSKTGILGCSPKSVVIASGRRRRLHVQLAWSVFGANPVVTAATGPDIELALSLGATDVVNYRQEDLFDTLANNSVDVVLDNLGFPGTADMALRVLRSGHEGTLSPNNKAGVTQVNFGLMQSITADVEALAGLFNQGSQQTKKTQSFNLADTPLAFNRQLVSAHEADVAPTL